MAEMDADLQLEKKAEDDPTTGSPKEPEAGSGGSPQTAASEDISDVEEEDRIAQGREGEAAQEAERMDDIVDEVEDLPLDYHEESNLVLPEGLPTVVEDPENEAKEQADLQQDGPDEEEIAEPDGEEGKSANHSESKVLDADDNVATTAGDSSQANDPAPENTDVDSETVPEETTAGDPDAELEPKADSDSCGAGGGSQDETVPTAETNETSVPPAGDNGGTETAAADGAGTETQPTDVPQDGPETDQTMEQQPAEHGLSQETENHSAEHTKRVKKTKKKKRRRPTEEQAASDTQPETETKQTMAHVRGGFSSGWIGPMLQLIGSMQKLEQFKVCYNRRFGPKGYGYGQGAGALQMNLQDGTEEGEAVPNKPVTSSHATIKAPEGQGCPRCGGAVFEAEKMQSRFRNYHKACFNCKECGRILDSTNACDGPDRDIYCKLCYSKKYGPKGYGFASGAAFLQSDAIDAEMPEGTKPEWARLNTTSIKAAPGQGCPRCGGAVFAAELMLSKGREWHKACFSCRDCRRPLDSTIACDGPDREIYCKTDYGRRFGPKGFGFGHAPTLVSGPIEDQVPNSTMNMQPSMGMKAPPGEGCPRCAYMVYAAEMMPGVKGKAYHRKCFSCLECNKSLDSTNACDGPDGDVHCRTCYGRNFGPKGVGFGLGAGVLSMG